MSAEMSFERYQAAVAAAERILKDTAKGKVAEDLLASGIEDVKNKLN